MFPPGQVWPAEQPVVAQPGWPGHGSHPAFKVTADWFDRKAAPGVHTPAPSQYCPGGQDCPAAQVRKQPH